jgi:hypothetical protein
MQKQGYRCKKTEQWEKPETKGILTQEQGKHFFRQQKSDRRDLVCIEGFAELKERPV